MRKRTLLTLMSAVSLAPLLGGCGFRLRGVPQFAFRSLYIQAGRGSTLARELERTLASSSEQLTVLRDPRSPDEAEVIFELLGERQERQVVGLNASGQVRELQLRLRLRFKLRKPNGDEVIPEIELVQQRDISYNETIALSKEAEEKMLYRNMQTDLVQQLIRRLAAVRPVP